MDLERLRRVAATRPGYATYPKTEPGSPSWWRRPLPGQKLVAEAVDAVPGPMATPPAPPPPPSVVPAPAPSLCELVALDGIGLVCASPDHQHDPGRLVRLDPVPAPKPPPADKAWLRTEPEPEPRRWWHRLTRRAHR